MVICEKQIFRLLPLRALKSLKQICVLEDLGDDDIALEPHLEVKTCDRFRVITIIRLMNNRFLPLSVVLVRCRHLQDLLVLQGTTKSTRKKSQQICVGRYYKFNYCVVG